MRAAFTMRCTRTAAFAACLILAPAIGASAQSLEPMRGTINSFTDQFALQVYPGNPYKHPIKLDVRVYDQNSAPVAANVFPSSFTIGAGEKRRVLVIVPFGSEKDRRVRVCVESLPNLLSYARIKTQICAKFHARNLG